MSSFHFTRRIHAIASCTAGYSVIGGGFFAGFGPVAMGQATSAQSRRVLLPGPGFQGIILLPEVPVFRGARLRLFSDDNFRGPSALIDSDVPDLRQLRFPDDFRRSWNDRISSLAVFRERDEWEHRHEGWEERRREERRERPYERERPY